MAIHKNIVLCSDGTGNTMMKGRGTNVWKLYEAVDLTAHRWHQGTGDGSTRGREQIAFYDDGVGSQQNKILKIAGGAFGYGLNRNIRDLYKSLCRAYRPGDDIYIFGFSRGAYTARVLAGLILSCGILRPQAWKTDNDLDRLSRMAYKAFRSHFRLGTTKGNQANNANQKATEAAHELKRAGEAASKSMSSKYEITKKAADKAIQEAKSARTEAEAETDEFRRKHSIHDDTYAPDGQVSIKFIGVWDTVAAVGLPFKGLTELWNRFVFPFMFPDNILSPRVEKGCHAISIDDERLTFHPMMWDERESGRSNPGQVEQVWFTGVHSNVGGGYPKQGISLVALDWMMQKAGEQGLKFIRSERDRYRHLQNVHDKLYNSRSGLAVYYRYFPRDIAKICQDHEVIPKIHISVLERIALGTQEYAPGNLPGDFEITTTDPNSGADLEDPEKLENVVKKIGTEVASRDVGSWITFRRFIYVGFIAMTLLVVGTAAWHHKVSEKTDTWVSASWDSALEWIASLVPFGGSLYKYFVQPFLIYWKFAVVAVVSLLIFYAASNFIQSKLQRTFAKFWRQKLPKPWW